MPAKLRLLHAIDGGPRLVLRRESSGQKGVGGRSEPNRTATAQPAGSAKLTRRTRGRMRTRRSGDAVFDCPWWKGLNYQICGSSAEYHRLHQARSRRSASTLKRHGRPRTAQRPDGRALCAGGGGRGPGSATVRLAVALVALTRLRLRLGLLAAIGCQRLADVVGFLESTSPCRGGRIAYPSPCRSAPAWRPFGPSSSSLFSLWSSSWPSDAPRLGGMQSRCLALLDSPHAGQVAGAFIEPMLLLRTDSAAGRREPAGRIS